MKSTERLLFLQGGKCFFCHDKIPDGEVSIEHLHAASRGGTNSDENCVVCCSHLNRLLGNLPLKDKLKVMLSQPQPFRCPINQEQVKVKAIEKVNVPVDEKHDAQALNDALIEFANCLKGNAKSRPRKLKTLTNHAENYLKKFSKTLHISASDFVQKALEKGWIEVNKSNGIVYHLKNKTIK